MQRSGSKPILAGSLVLSLVFAVLQISPVEAGQAVSPEGATALGFFSVDPVSPGSLSQWEPFLDPRNPEFTYEEIAGEYIEGAAIRTSVVGNTVSQCRTQHIARQFELSGNALEARLKAYLEFEFSGSYYNLPMIRIYLYDQDGEEIGSRIYYGKDIIGGYHLNVIFPNDNYIELPDDKGDMIIDLSHFGDVDFSSVEINLRNYTCIGTNSLVFDNLRAANVESIIFQDRFNVSD